MHFVRPPAPFGSRPAPPDRPRTPGEKLLYAPRALAYSVPPFLKMKRLIPSLLGILACAGTLRAQNSVYSSSEDFDRFARKLRESALSSIEPRVFVPTTSSYRGVAGRYPWKVNIVTTVFWVGESAGMNNPVHNRSSSWDMDWAYNFGGYDNPDPATRANYLPVGFIPKENPFYVALPYNDISGGHWKPEASAVIPWFREAIMREGLRDGQSVCHNRWIAVRKGGHVCYAQWSDCGPFSTVNWEYVFGGEIPKPNLNHGAGLDVSPAVRDYLGLGPMDVVDWKFVEERDVPINGPWARLGSNNTVAQHRGRSATTVVDAAPLPTKGKSKYSAAADLPTVLNH